MRGKKTVKWLLAVVLFTGIFRPVALAAPADVTVKDYATTRGMWPAEAGGSITREDFAYALDNWIIFNQALLTRMGYAPSARPVEWTDVADSPRYESIYNLTAMGLCDGYLFRPEERLTRQEALGFIFPLMNIMPYGYNEVMSESYYLRYYIDADDVAPEYQSAVSAAHMLGLATGYTDFHFRPLQAITLQEIFTVLMRLEVQLRDADRRGMVTAGTGEIIRIAAKNVRPDGFDVEITVTDNTVGLNPHVTVARTTDPTLAVTEESLLGGYFLTDAFRLTEMRRAGTQPGQATYSASIGGQAGATYYVSVILGGGEAVSLHELPRAVNLPYPSYTVTPPPYVTPPPRWPVATPTPPPIPTTTP